MLQSWHGARNLGSRSAQPHRPGRRRGARRRALVAHRQPHTRGGHRPARERPKPVGALRNAATDRRGGGRRHATARRSRRDPPRADRRRVSRAIADTSVFIAREAGRPLGELPDEIAVSVVTAAELELGVLRAHDAATRATRLATLSRVRAEYPLLPIDDATASCFAR